MNAWIRSFPLELWYSLAWPLSLSAVVLFLRLVSRHRRSTRQSETAGFLAPYRAALSWRMTDGTTRLQVLVWGIAVVTDLYRSFESHLSMHPPGARFLSWLVASFVLGLMTILALDGLGRLLTLRVADRFRYSAGVLMVPLWTFAACLVFLAGVWNLVSLSVERGS